MVTALELKARLTARPFVPFRICMSDGKTYDITNHDMMWVTRNAVYIGVILDADDIAERTVQGAILHITRVEDNIPAKAA
jgi:hypothetical protein